MGYYDIDKLTYKIFPWFWLEKDDIRAFALLLVHTLGEANDRFEKFEKDTRQRVKVSSQRLSLELSLNDRFDPTQKRITVSNVTSELDGYVFNEVEAVSPALSMYVFNTDEALPSTATERFIFNEAEETPAIEGGIVVPVEYQGKENEIRAWIDAAVQFGVTYNLTFI